MPTAFITGLSGETLQPAERAFLAEAQPAGLILFARNCRTREQIRRLVDDFRDAVGSDRNLVLIDQEGGRVQRLRPPLARLLPPAAAFMAHHGHAESTRLRSAGSTRLRSAGSTRFRSAESTQLQQAGSTRLLQDADVDVDAACRDAFLVARLTADDLRPFGVNTSCAPVLDVPVAGAHDIIGNRAYGLSPSLVLELGGAVADGLMAGGVLPVMKHIPGHGRAHADSHLELPVVAASRADLAATDFAPFRALRRLPAAMTAHVLYTALDAQHPASTSASLTRDIIRGDIGFDGLLMSDDLGMSALTGSMVERTRAVLAAGSDLALHCNGDLAEMRDVARAAPPLAGRALARFDAAVAVTLAPRSPYDMAEAEAVCERLLALTA